MAGVSRALLTLCIATSLALNVQAQWDTKPYFGMQEQTEKRYLPELIEELKAVHDDALLIYTEFSATSGGNYKNFIKTLNEVVYGKSSKIDEELMDKAPEHCKAELQKELSRIRTASIKSASASADNHQRYFLGPMTVFRMHLNKTETYIRRAKKNRGSCITPECETAPNVMRWRKLAAFEINRIKSDIANTRPMFRDLIVHFKHRLIRIWRSTEVKLKSARETFQNCVHQ